MRWGTEHERNRDGRNWRIKQNKEEYQREESKRYTMETTEPHREQKKKVERTKN